MCGLLNYNKSTQFFEVNGPLYPLPILPFKFNVAHELEVSMKRILYLLWFFVAAVLNQSFHPPGVQKRVDLPNPKQN